MSGETDTGVSTSFQLNEIIIDCIFGHITCYLHRSGDVVVFNQAVNFGPVFIA